MRCKTDQVRGGIAVGAKVPPKKEKKKPKKQKAQLSRAHSPGDNKLSILSKQ